MSFRTNSVAFYRVRMLISWFCEFQSLTIQNSFSPSPTLYYRGLDDRWMNLLE